MIFEELTFHHIGLIVRDMDEAVEHYTQLFGEDNVSEVFTLESQQVLECFVKNGVNSRIGLVSPMNEESVVYNLMKKGGSYYHLAYTVKNIDEMVEKLEALNYKALAPFASEAFSNNNCIFLFTPEGHLVELIEE